MSWRVHLGLGRVSNLPTVWSNVLAGAVLSGGRLEAGVLGALLIALSLFYIGGMYLNDAFDRKIDARERPERPIPSGKISAAKVFGIGYGMLAAAIVILVVMAGGWSDRPGWPAVASGGALGAVIVYYDARHKRDPLSPLWMGLCRVLIYTTVGLAVAGHVSTPLIGGALILLSYLIGLTYVAKQETLTEYRNLWPLLFLFAPFVYSVSVFSSTGGALIYAGFLGWVCYAISWLIRKGRVNIPRAVISFIAGISLLDALLIAGAGRPGLALWGIAGFVLTLFFQRYVRGT
jgi:4-hydroxybenzoate polyprenyltransferase